MTACEDPPPSSLVGNLRVPGCTCPLGPDGATHGGQHRSAMTVAGVGKVVVKWKNWRVSKNQPPVVTLPSPSAPHIQANRGFHA